MKSVLEGGTEWAWHIGLESVDRNETVTVLLIFLFLLFFLYVLIDIKRLPILPLIKILVIFKVFGFTGNELGKNYKLERMTMTLAKELRSGSTHYNLHRLGTSSAIFHKSIVADEIDADIKKSELCSTVRPNK